ncbi:MAG: hypothetical protein JW957_06320 [Candidatus Omnitrophica bacterium]|nr:hypothetical protein [Candidatus Omnitrophota bacterium]
MAYKNDGIRGMVPAEKMCENARKLRDTYKIKPDAPLFQKEFGFLSLEAWKKQGMPKDVPLRKLFGFDEPGNHYLTGLGWCEAGFMPAFPEKMIEDRGVHEVIQDKAGRYVLYFKGRRSGFMPEYLDHPVKDMKTWEEKCKWRLNPETPERYKNLQETLGKAKKEAATGKIISQQVVGGYMYLRSLIGPEGLLYKFYDEPELIHKCMKTWLELADAVISKHQEQVSLDEFFIAEDICYNKGPLISPEMIKEFLFPYYRQLIGNIKSRQLDKNRHLYFQVDTDGYAPSVIPLYMDIGMDVMSPFEAASGCDVLEIGREFPGMVISGGIDKRILAKGKDAIDRYIDHVLPAMKKRGGYIPTCDHDVPEEVPYEDYFHYRKRCLEFAGEK